MRRNHLAVKSEVDGVPKFPVPSSMGPCAIGKSDGHKNNPRGQTILWHNFNTF